MKKIFLPFENKKITKILIFSLVLIGFSLIFLGGSTVWGVTGGSGGSGSPGSTGNVSNGRGIGAEQEGIPLCGFAWGATTEASKMGVGWLSFSSKDCDTNGNGTISASEAAAVPGCPAGATGTYGVYLDESNEINGYAWSNNLGWVKFGGLSGNPTGNGTSGNTQQQARIVGNANIHGWARACSGTSNGDCRTMSSRSDGWDGWISLRGTSPDYGVNFSGQNFSGYSWGGPVVGWLNWNPGSGNGVRLCSTQSLTATVTASPTTGPVPLTSTITATANLTSLAQRQLAQGGGSGLFEYRFKCFASDSFSVWGSTNTRSCTYPTAGIYTATGEIRYLAPTGTLNATGYATIDVTNPSEPPGGENALGATCSVSTPAYVNQTVSWTVQLQTASGATPYTYVFDFGTGLQTVPSSNTSVTIGRTYSTVGEKTLRVDVTDSASPSPARGFCEEEVRVEVNPNFRER